ncbi:dihydrolipoyl dehydrogenase [Arenimonas maotaiensis]|uniref:Dihydrolipoyl dehydrogenase n=1 Tax=Arenimonas maotaiensis TaxID=1446479 RepID=A0A917CKD3_9GAMM|nr:dihydrolipoyl dehydrogenase [Arenimonas maotaiensis]GGF89428.1 dihydrolipoyl dehydrogenase [Arenimonas maotaiensis]
MAAIELKVPDIGGSAAVIEFLVKEGDTVAANQGLLTLESDKATMEVPASAGGVLTQWKVKLGDTLSEGDVIALLESAPIQTVGAPLAAPSAAAPVNVAAVQTVAAAPLQPAPVSAGDADHRCQLVVIGSGPGGYTAAFRAADLGMDVILVERYAELGGVCLNVGCIPSKALLHAANVIEEARHAADYGIAFGEAKIDLDKLRAHKEKTVGTLNKGIAGMAKQRKVRTLTGTAEFASANRLSVNTAQGVETVDFAQCIIAAGSQPVKLPAFPWDDPRVMDSTGALMLKDVPKRLLVVGGGIIGLEMACLYSALGSAVTVVEFMDQLMPGADPDLVKPLQALLKKRGVAIHTSCKVAKVTAGKKALSAEFEGASVPSGTDYDRVLVSVGRSPNGGKLKAENAGVQVSERGFIAVDKQMRTNVPHIFAIGDLVGQPMLAHKATHEAKVAAEVAAGHKREWVARVIPSVAYTDPEIAWVGLTETEAKAKGIAYELGKFPWAASGRAIGIGRTEGFTKLLFDPATHRVIGGGIVGAHAGDLIAEIALAIEMGCEAGDIGHTIHPHPTLSETVAMAAEVFDGSITDLYVPKKK